MSKMCEKELLNLVDSGDFAAALQEYVQKHDLPYSVLQRLVEKTVRGISDPEGISMFSWVDSQAQEAYIVLEKYLEKRSFPREILEWLAKICLAYVRLFGLLMTPHSEK